METFISQQQKKPRELELVSMIDMTIIYNYIIRYRKKLTILWPKFKKTLDIREKHRQMKGIYQ